MGIIKSVNVILLTLLIPLSAAFFWFGYEYKDIQIDKDRAYKSKLKTCAAMYKSNPSRTLAGDFCVDYFKSLRVGHESND